MTRSTPLLPPQDLESELAVIGAIVQSPSAMDETVAIIAAAGDFYDRRLRRLYEAALRLYTRGEPIDALTLVREAEAGTEPTETLSPLVIEAMESCPIAGNVGSYAKSVRRQSEGRRILMATQTIQHLVASNAPDLVSETERLIYAATVAQVDDSISIGTLADRVLDKLERAAQGDESTFGIPTGFRDLDRKIGGLRAGQLVLVAGGTGTGKTALMCNIARNVAGAGTLVGFFSLEMDPEEVALRILCAEASASWSTFSRETNLTDNATWQRLHAAIEVLTPLPLEIAPVARDPIRLLSWCRRHKPGLVVVDYLQLMARPTRKGESRNDVVAEVSRALKLLAMELQIPVLAASQLNRTGSRERRRPMLADLRDSGALEQDADIVVFIHEKPRGEFKDHELIVAKHRNGDTGAFSIEFRPAFMRFQDGA